MKNLNVKIIPSEIMHKLLEESGRRRVGVGVGVGVGGGVGGGVGVGGRAIAVAGVCMRMGDLFIVPWHSVKLGRVVVGFHFFNEAVATMWAASERDRERGGGGERERKGEIAK